MRVTDSRGRMKTLPSPISPVRAARQIASTTEVVRVSGTTSSIFTLGTRSTVYSAPRYCSLWPFWRPNPRTSLTVRPCTPTCVRADLTSSSLWGLMMASTFFMPESPLAFGCPRIPSSPGDGTLRGLVHDHATVAGRAHLGDVQAFDFHRRRHAIPDDRLDDLVDHDRDDADVGDARHGADRLGCELPRVPEEEALDWSVDVVEAPGGVAPVGKEPDRQHAPEAVGAVDRDRAHRVVDLELPLDEEDRFDHQDSGDQSDDAGAEGPHERAGRGDRDQACEHAVAHHGRVGLVAANLPDPQGRCHGAR